MDNRTLNILSWKYIGTGVLMTGLLSVAGFFLIQKYDIRWALIVSMVFTTVVYVAEGRVWYRVASKAADSLTTFFTACSAFRLLLALVTIFIYYMVKGREAMMPFFLTFAAYYVVQLAHHSTFFARITNRS